MGYGCMGPAPAPLPTAEMAQESTFGGGIGVVNGDVKVVCGAMQRSGEQKYGQLRLHIRPHICFHLAKCFLYNRIEICRMRDPRSSSELINRCAPIQPDPSGYSRTKLLALASGTDEDSVLKCRDTMQG